jgi:outer membrane protein
MPSNSRFVNLLLSLAIATPAFAQSAQQPPLVVTLGGAARIAAEKSAAPEAARQRVAQAEARVRQRRSEFLPNLSIAASDAERTFNSATFGIEFRDAATGRFLFDPNGQVLGPVKTWDLRGTLRQNLFDFGSFARLSAAKASVTAVTSDASGAGQQAAAVAAQAYVRAVRADAQLSARVADSTLADELLGIAQSQAAGARASLISARNERNRSRLELYRALGLPLGSPITLADSLLGLPTNSALPTEQEATERAMRTRADLRAADEQMRAAELQFDAIKAERLPSLGLFADQGSIGKSTSHLLPTYTWGIQLSLPVFDGFRREGRQDEQRAVIKELDVRKRDLTQQTTIEVRGALLDLASAREQLAANEERLGLAEQELTQARDRFKAGVAGNADVITASVNLNASRAQMIDARAAFQNARVALARAQGTVTELP